VVRDSGVVEVEEVGVMLGGESTLVGVLGAREDERCGGLSISPDSNRCC
jgi:hypothetical protein